MLKSEQMDREKEERDEQKEELKSDPKYRKRNNDDTHIDMGVISYN